jgi:hypothetical protein
MSNNINLKVQHLKNINGDQTQGRISVLILSANLNHTLEGRIKLTPQIHEKLIAFVAQQRNHEQYVLVERVQVGIGEVCASDEM